MYAMVLVERIEMRYLLFNLYRNPLESLLYLTRKVVFRAQRTLLLLVSDNSTLLKSSKTCTLYVI